ncbi:hypothetical protein ACRV3R_001546 [Citrobacter freundii]
MTKTRRIIHHACWFAVLGPHLGVPVAIAYEALTNYRTLGYLLLEILSILPFFMALTWFQGGLAALLTGFASACLPAPVYHCTWLRTLTCGASGAAIATLCWLLFNRVIVPDLFWMSTGPGLLAGLIMGWLVPYLPFRGENKYVSPEIVKMNSDVAQPERKV